MKSASKKQGIGFLGVLLAGLATGCGQVSSVDAGAGVEAASSPGSETGEGHAPSDDAESKIRFGTTDTQKIPVGLIRNRYQGYEKICSGVMIAPNVVITDKRCLDVPAGVTNGWRWVSISKVGDIPDRVYPAAEVKTFTYLALVKLNQNVGGISFDNAPRIWDNLPSFDSSKVLLTAYGFGTDQKVATSDLLRKRPNFRFQSEVDSRLTGVSGVSGPVKSSPYIIINTVGQNGAGLCQRDSGGGLFFGDHLLGISSSSDPCGQNVSGTSIFYPPYAERKEIEKVYAQWTISQCTSKKTRTNCPPLFVVREQGPTPSPTASFQKITCQPPQLHRQVTQCGNPPCPPVSPPALVLPSDRSDYGVTLSKFTRSDPTSRCLYNVTVLDGPTAILTNTGRTLDGSNISISVPKFIEGSVTRPRVEIQPVEDSATRCPLLGSLLISPSPSPSQVTCTLE